MSSEKRTDDTDTAIRGKYDVNFVSSIESSQRCEQIKNLLIEYLTKRLATLLEAAKNTANQISIEKQEYHRQMNNVLKTNNAVMSPNELFRGRETVANRQKTVIDLLVTDFKKLQTMSFTDDIEFVHASEQEFSRIILLIKEVDNEYISQSEDFKCIERLVSELT